MNLAKSNNLISKNERFTTPGWKDIGFIKFIIIIKFDFVAKTQFL